MAATALLAAGCAGRAPAPNDPELSQGAVQALPLADPFPRIGLQWTYDVSHTGWPKDARFPPMVAYRLTDKNAFGHPWGGWWLYKGELFAEGTGATFLESGLEDVFWHPPRTLAMEALEWAPWPLAKPGRAGSRARLLRLGEGWEGRGPSEVKKTYSDLRYEETEVPAGNFSKAWRVDGESPDWNGSFWWVKSVGFVRMEWTAKDGRKLSLRLKDVRLIESK